MINAIGKQAIQFKIIETERPKVKTKWCEEQQNDFGRVFQMVEELVAAAANSRSNVMSYEQLEEAKVQFIGELLEIGSKYRLVDDTIQNTHK